jgi:MipA family protein
VAAKCHGGRNSKQVNGEPATGALTSGSSLCEDREERKMLRGPTISASGAALICILAMDQAATAAEFTIGAGAGVRPDYQGSDDYEAVPLWNLRVGDLYHPETFVQVFGPRLTSNLLPHDHWRLGIAGQFIEERDDVEDDRIDDLRSVDASALLGLIAGYDLLADPQQDLVLELEGRQDVADDNGFLGTIRGRYGSPFAQQWRLDALVETTWASEDYMSSYFGIDAGDAARSGLDQFNADEDFKDVTFGGSLTYRFLENWSATATGTYTRLLGDAEDSPVVEDRGDEDQIFGGVLVNYRF